MRASVFAWAGSRMLAAAVSSRSLASPKSSTFTASAATMMFAALMSRCRTPRACAAHSASATPSIQRSAVASGGAPSFLSASDSVRPSTSSSTRMSSPPCETTSNSVTTLG